jgi:parvulin-like peptidyl-prolyl isomerase
MINVKPRILIVLLLLAGCGEKPKYTAEQLAAMPLAKRDGLPEPSGGFALVVGDQAVTAEEVVGPVFEKLAQAAQRSDFERFRQLAGPVIEQQLANRIADALLYSKAKKEAGEQIDDELDRVAAAEVRKFVMDFGGDYAKAEEALRRAGMDWGTFEQYKRRLILSQSYYAQQIPDRDQPVTYNEMITAYNDSKNKLYTTPAVLQFRLIDIEPAKLQNPGTQGDPNKSRLQQARELAEQLVGRIRQGESFEQLANNYSQGPGASTGGLWRKLDPESLAPPYDVLATKAPTMKPGEITEPIENQGHIFIMQLVEYQPRSVEPFEKVQNQVKAGITAERMRKAFDKINNELLQQASAADRTRFVDFCAREIYRMANK